MQALVTNFGRDRERQASTSTRRNLVREEKKASTQTQKHTPPPLPNKNVVVSEKKTQDIDESRNIKPSAIGSGGGSAGDVKRSSSSGGTGDGTIGKKIEKKIEPKIEPKIEQRTTRERKQPERFQATETLRNRAGTKIGHMTKVIEPPIETPIPKTLKQAQTSGYWEGFKDAIKEIQTLKKRDLGIHRPQGTNTAREICI